MKSDQKTHEEYCKKRKETNQKYRKNIAQYSGKMAQLRLRKRVNRAAYVARKRQEAAEKLKKKQE